MSTQITTAFVNQFSSNITMLSQQMGSLLREAVDVETVTGEKAFFDQVGSAVAQVRTSRHGDTPLMETPHARRMVTMSTYEYADLIDGLTVSVGRSDLNSAQANGTEEQTMSASYAMGGITLMWADHSMDDDAAGGTDYDARHLGVSFAVNDDLTVSYDVSKSDKSGAAVDETSSSIQASYTMGSMTVKGHVSKTDDSGFVSGAEDNGKAVAVSWAF